MKLIVVVLAIILVVPVSAFAAAVVSQPPTSGGGVGRSSQLWVDPGPNGNDSDGDFKCWTDFNLQCAAQLNHIEWWGNYVGTGTTDQGFRIEFWRQDPGTIAYQPLAVFDGQPGKNPEARFTIDMADIATSVEGGLTHYAVDLPSLVSLAANGASNPRWFVGVVGLTSDFSGRWNWSQGVGPGQGTYQWNRGSFDGGGPQFRSMGDNRAMEISAVPEPATPTLLLAAAVIGLRRRRGKKDLGGE